MEGKWYKWYERSYSLGISLTLINCDTEEEIDIFMREPGIFEGYTDPYFIYPNFSDERKFRSHKWLSKEGNYIIRYWLEYLTYETQEPKIVTIDLPITVIPNESDQTFYSNPSYPVPAFEEYEPTSENPD